MSVLVKFQIEIRFLIELHRNSKRLNLARIASKCRLVQVLGCFMDSKYSKWINSPLSYHSPKPSLRTHLSLNFSKTWNQFYMNCRNTKSCKQQQEFTTTMTFKWKNKNHTGQCHRMRSKLSSFKQKLPPQWFVLLIGPDIFSVTTWIPTTDFNTATSPSPIIMIIVHPSSGLSFYGDGVG